MKLLSCSLLIVTLAAELFVYTYGIVLLSFQAFIQDGGQLPSADHLPEQRR